MLYAFMALGLYEVTAKFQRLLYALRVYGNQALWLDRYGNRLYGVSDMASSL